jgi:hypothetical protein
LGIHPELTIDNTSVSYEIWILPGAMTPVVLQPLGDAYLLIGECYVHGLMEGQALREKEYMDNLQDIEIC